jgi:hypothetical protein
MPQELERLHDNDQAPEFAEVVGCTTAEVLETMFFTEAVMTECEHAWIGSAVSAGLRFEGTHTGEILLNVGAETADLLASGFLGLDPVEVSQTQRSQVILELANVLGGAALSQLWPESKLALRAPEMADASYRLAGGFHRCFTLPEGTLALSIRLGEGSAF